MICTTTANMIQMADGCLHVVRDYSTQTYVYGIVEKGMACRGMMALRQPILQYHWNIRVVAEVSKFHIIRWTDRSPLSAVPILMIVIVAFASVFSYWRPVIHAFVLTVGVDYTPAWWHRRRPGTSLLHLQTPSISHHLEAVTDRRDEKKLTVLLL